MQKNLRKKKLLLLTAYEKTIVEKHARLVKGCKNITPSIKC